MGIGRRQKLRMCRSAPGRPWPQLNIKCKELLCQVGVQFISIVYFIYIVYMQMLHSDVSHVNET